MTTSRFTHEELFTGVREEVADCLAVDLEEVTSETNFRLDLGGESIDFLDLAFRCEKRFGIRLPHSRLTSPEKWKIDSAGRPTEEMLDWLQSEFPRVDWNNHLTNTSLDDPLNLFTIRLIVDLLFDVQFDAASATFAKVASSESPMTT